MEIKNPQINGFRVIFPRIAALEEKLPSRCWWRGAAVDVVCYRRGKAFEEKCERKKLEQNSSALEKRTTLLRRDAKEASQKKKKVGEKNVCRKI